MQRPVQEGNSTGSTADILVNLTVLTKYEIPDDSAANFSETNNLFFTERTKREEMQKLLKELIKKEGGRTAPLGR
ncbi:MAG: hypothetical protein RL346_940 [Verrucomicrobiota bacterium]|jgi:hypothetical protein